MKLLPFDYAIRNLGRSPKRLLLVIGGSALVSTLVLGSVAFSRGLEASMNSSGLQTNAIVLGSGSEESVERSEIPAATGPILAASVDGLAMLAGQPVVSSEIHVSIPVANADTPTVDDATAVLIRGFEPMAFAVHPQVRLTEGRWPARGTDEIAAAPEALAKVPGVTLGSKVLISGIPFVVVGLFDAPGTVMHGEFWMRLDRVTQLTQRTTHSLVVAALGTAELGDIDSFTSSRLDLEAVSMLESEYYAKLAEFFAPIRILVLVTAVLISSGGALGGVNAMYAAFSSRVREVGTLQALGFSRFSIAVSLILESTVACVTGSLCACLLGVLLLDGISIRFSMGAFGLSVDGASIACALLAGLLLGLLGAIPAIIRCLTLPIPSALRS